MQVMVIILDVENPNPIILSQHIPKILKHVVPQAQLALVGVYFVQMNYQTELGHSILRQIGHKERLGDVRGFAFLDRVGYSSLRVFHS